MNQKKGRFERLELFPLIKVFKKSKVELKRFERLEVEGHKIKIKITEEIPRGYITCPKCQRNSPKDSLYCIYCNHIFESIAEETKDVELEPWEIRCPGCGRIGVRTQKNCLYCGWRIAPLEKDEVLHWQEGGQLPEDPLKQGEVVTLTIDGKTYCSTDKIIPLDVKELMLKIKKEGYSKEMVDEWVRGRNVKQEELRQNRFQDLQYRIQNLRYEIFWRAGLVIGGLILIYLFRNFLFRLGR